MSEQEKKKRRDPALIISCIICAAAIILITVLAVRAAKISQAAEREGELSRQSASQSAVAESESMLAAANSEEERILNQASDICKNYKYSAHITLNKSARDPEKVKTDDPIRYVFDVRIRLDPPEKIKDWLNFCYFLEELKGIKSVPFIEVSATPYYIYKYTEGAGEELEGYYFSYIDSYGLISVSATFHDGHYWMKTDKGVLPLSEVLPYKGMSEDLIDRTKLGKHENFTYTKTYNSKSKQTEILNRYYWYGKYSNSGIYQLCEVEVRKGKVVSVEYTPDNGASPKASSSSGGLYNASANRPAATTRKAYYDDDPYNARDFNDPEDFYDYYYDDFEDYEEAYDYFYEHNPD